MVRKTFQILHFRVSIEYEALCALCLKILVKFRFFLQKTEWFFSVCWAYDTENDVHVVVAGGNRGIIRVIDVVTGDLVNVCLLMFESVFPF